MNALRTIPVANYLGLNEAKSAVQHVLQANNIPTQGLRKTGSAYYGKEDPSDFDVLVHVPVGTDLAKVMSAFEKDGWENCATSEGVTSGGDTDSEDYCDLWISVRKGQSNAIITNDQVWYHRQLASTELVKTLSAERGEPLFKSEVIRIFRLVREGCGE